MKSHSGRTDAIARGAIGGLLAALIGVPLAVAAPAAHGAVAPNGQIAYVVNAESTIPFGPPTQQDIWVINADGTGAADLTATSEIDEFEPAWSPDGTKIAYISDSFTRTLSVMNADGSGKTAVIDGASSPSWGPDGTKIAYLGTREGLPNAIMIADLVAGTQTVVTEAADMEPVWSPDGSKIAFVAVRPESYPDPAGGEPQIGAQHEIVVVNADGTGEVIVSAGSVGSDHATYLEEDRAPAWSPDGSMLVFMSQAQNPACCGPWQLWGVNADGSGLTNLSADATVNDTYPAWSPDGTSLVFTRTSGAGQDLFTMPAPTALPIVAPVARVAVDAVAVDPLAVDPAAAGVTGLATPLTTTGNAADPAWGARRATPATFTLSTQVIGRGVISSRPAGILCGTDCTQAYPAGTQVTLRATPRPGSRFVRWEGACTGKQRTCTVTMDRAKNVTARFRR